jgi:hypothetical protein
MELEKKNCLHFILVNLLLYFSAPATSGHGDVKCSNELLVDPDIIQCNLVTPHLSLIGPRWSAQVGPYVMLSDHISWY